MYAPKFPPFNVDLKGLAEYVRTEFDAVAQAQYDTRDVLYLNPLAKEPNKPRPGMVVYANGTNWNPGSGEGMYRRSAAGAWVFIG